MKKLVKILGLILIACKLIKALSLVALDSVFYLYLYFKNRRKPKKGIALIKLDEIGDFFLWLGTAEKMRREIPRSFVLIANSLYASFAKTLPYWDEVISVDTKKLERSIPYRWQLFGIVANYRFETIIQPTHVSSLLKGDSLVRMSLAKERIGSKGDISRWLFNVSKRISNRWYNKLIPFDLTIKHELHKNTAFISQFFCRKFENRAFCLERSATYIHPLLDGLNYFLIFPGASANAEYKMWPKEKFAALGKRIMKERGLVAAVCGSKTERELCEWIAKETGGINLSGETEIGEAVEIIRNSKFVVGNDSASVHIAAAVKTPAFCIVGGGAFGAFIPYPEFWQEPPVPIYYNMPCYHCSWRCIYRLKSERIAFPCISNITVEMVFKKVNNSKII